MNVGKSTEDKTEECSAASKDSQDLIKEAEEATEEDDWTPEEICFLDSPTAD
jgi:hypothetical protein